MKSILFILGILLGVTVSGQIRESKVATNENEEIINEVVVLDKDSSLVISIPVLKWEKGFVGESDKDTLWFLEENKFAKHTKFVLQANGEELPDSSIRIRNKEIEFPPCLFRVPLQTYWVIERIKKIEITSRMLVFYLERDSEFPSRMVLVKGKDQFVRLKLINDGNGEPTTTDIYEIEFPLFDPRKTDIFQGIQIVSK